MTARARRRPAPTADDVAAAWEDFAALPAAGPLADRDRAAVRRELRGVLSLMPARSHPRRRTGHLRLVTHDPHRSPAPPQRAGLHGAAGARPPRPLRAVA